MVDLKNDKRILLIQPEVLGGGIYKALNSLPIYSMCYSYNYKKIAYKLSRLLKNTKIVERSITQQFNFFIINKLEYIIKNNNINLLIIICGEKLSDKSKEIFSNLNIPIYFWLIDSISRYPDREDIIKYSSKVLFHDGIDFKESKHSNKYWQPFGFDHTLFEPQKKIYDLALTGYLKLPEYKKRVGYLREILKDKNFKLKKIALLVADPDNVLKDIDLGDNVNYFGRLPIDEYAKKIASSKVCVNILQSDGGMPINPLFFAIGYSNTIQVVDNREYLSEFLNNDCYVKFTKDKLIEGLNNLFERLDEYNFIETKESSYKYSFTNIFDTLINENE